MKPQADSEWIPEATLAEELNVPRSTLKAERPYLEAGEVAEQGGAVVWLKKAGQRVAQKLGLIAPLAEKNAPSEAPAPAESFDAGELLTVQSQPGNAGYHFPNPRIIKATRANGEPVIVSVMDSRKYTTRLRVGGKPMTFHARKSAHGNHWTLTGREPRYPGQW